MSSLAQLVSATRLAGRVFNERQLAEVLGGSDARRYGLVNRALKDGSLIRVKRSTYVLGEKHRSDPIHPFAIAQSLVPGSYISFESALAYHGWIPEAAFVTASVSPGRKTMRFETGNFGMFGFHPLAIAPYQFLTAVDRVTFNKASAFVAQPLRALIDLVALRKEPWSGIAWATRGMRIDEDRLLRLRRRDVSVLKAVYKHKAVGAFLTSLERAVMEAREFPVGA
ncbi:MAG: hypothetical protein DI533_22175 [Cereibacter sphaeroides]|uniref:Transcriptional regulator n=1 Tax=Cereibacter sphaeroides TaxID=1063 RepID=A0A2W5S670_CERSP|nr:MAG: hypothetical protein DI533_22175 [Cereibacter sphaeroides]